jgi:hypothetical protein
VRLLAVTLRNQAHGLSGLERKPNIVQIQEFHQFADFQKWEAICNRVDEQSKDFAVAMKPGPWRH